ncbi:methyl-accepting chemotaxis protein [Anaerobranca gottschalkii]|uniref:Methyl-accepting chemotaxis protein n=1 Tax=Anaerobranca gottschalkii DSM 13577 TaxID=1120990 RepID=A0A1I0CNE7_9FIRM|nr:methyl-accepting chemotaxis protein [Anaerobranca gottschalkii]SET21188.1 methyl-accepting chemotaxis protein [Anaerobranca gottschalkii DSM 13577]
MKVGIIGAGVGGTSILKILSELNTVDVLWITDINSHAEGIKFAKEKGIRTGDDFLNFLHSLPVDCIIEATGVDKVKRILMENVPENITVIDGQAANLLMEIVSGRDNLIKELKNMAFKLEQDLTNLNQGILDVGKVLEEIKNGTYDLSQMGERLVEESYKTKEAFNRTQEILGFIKSISKQSKILGINSAIEAARAGELGRGFGVVAEEIRTMADSSEKSVEEIQQVILDIQNNMDGVQKGINIASDVAHKQAEATERASILLKKLSSISREIKEFAEELVSL